MRLELCNFTGYKIYPGRGRTWVKSDGKSYHLLNKRAEHNFWDKVNPRCVTWTVLCRKLHKKGTSEEFHKKKSRKTVKIQRGVEGNTLESIIAKKTQSQAFRKEQREQAIKKAKDSKIGKDGKRQKVYVHQTINKNINFKGGKVSNKPVSGTSARR